MAIEEKAKVNLSNVQELVIRPYNFYISRHLFFNFENAESARSFLRACESLISYGTPAEKPQSAVNLGLTFSGLVKLEVPGSVLSQFPADFSEGPTYQNFAEFEGREGFNRMMDLGTSSPEHWWHGRFVTDDIHCILHLYASTDSQIDELTSKIRTVAEQFEVHELHGTGDGKPLEGRSLGGQRVHFGYKDGIAQPQVRWSDDGTVGEDFRQFILGYATSNIVSKPNPLLDPPSAEFVRDSSYLVFRWVYQNVPLFNRYLDEQSKREEVMLWARAVLGQAASPAEIRELIAAKLVGRWRNGTPLVLSPTSQNPPSDLTSRDDFTYNPSDTNGFACPFSSHIRVTNPRDQETNLGERPRLIRRGHPYGPLPIPEDSTADDEVDRGLIGLFICSNISEQFYKITGWMNVNDFSNVFDPNPPLPQDPLFANRDVRKSSRDFLIPHGSGTVRLTDLPNFLQTRGTAFTLLPSASTLAAITAH